LPLCRDRDPGIFQRHSNTNTPTIEYWSSVIKHDWFHFRSTLNRRRRRVRKTSLFPGEFEDHLLTGNVERQKLRLYVPFVQALTKVNFLQRLPARIELVFPRTKESFVSSNCRSCLSDIQWVTQQLRCQLVHPNPCRPLAFQMPSLQTRSYTYEKYYYLSSFHSFLRSWVFRQAFGGKGGISGNEKSRKIIIWHLSLSEGSDGISTSGPSLTIWIEYAEICIHDVLFHEKIIVRTETSPRYINFILPYLLQMDDDN
jgi:hypothetical protein